MRFCDSSRSLMTKEGISRELLGCLSSYIIPSFDSITFVSFYGEFDLILELSMSSQDYYGLPIVMADFSYDLGLPFALPEC